MVMYQVRRKNFHSNEINNKLNNMTKHSLHSVAVQVEQMRSTQKLYFQQIGSAKRSRKTDDFTAASATLRHSKQLEEAVDFTIEEIVKEGKEERS